MQPRMDYKKANPAAVEAMAGLQAHLGSSGLDPALVTLVEIRASQINRCGY